MRISLSTIAINCAALVAVAISTASLSRDVGVEYRKALFAAPITFDPVMMDDGASLVVSELVYEGLLRLTNDYGFEGALAESWTTSSDGKILTFKLRKDAKFSNGELVSPDDVVSSLSRAVSKESRVHSYYDNIEGADAFIAGSSKLLSGLRAIDSQTIEIHLKKPFPPFMYVLAGATAKILPRTYLAANTFSAPPIGSGPFAWSKSEKLKDLTTITLVRNPHFKGSKGNIDRFVLVVTSEAKATDLARAGQLDDLASWPLTGKESVFAAGVDVSSLVTGTWIIGLNSRVSPFESLDVRRYFRESFDSEKFRRTFYSDAAPAFGYIPLGFPGSLTAPTETYSAVRKVPSSKRITIAIPEGLANGEKIAAFIENEFKTAGWNVKAEILPWAKLMEGYANKKLQAFLVNMNVDYPDSEFLLRNFASSNPDNFSGMNSKELDDLLSEARSTTDRVAREAKYRKAAQMVDNFVPSINLFHPRAHAWVSRCVKGFEPNLLSDIYIDYSKVSLESRCLNNRGSF